MLWFAALAVSMSTSTQAESSLDEIERDLNAEFDDAYSWWLQVYDPESGGCFYSLSAKELAAKDQRFGPDIESTAKLVGVLSKAGVLSDAPASFRQGVVDFIRSRQDPVTGLFQDPQHVDQYTPNTLERAATMAQRCLDDCGGQAAYPTLFDRLKTDSGTSPLHAHLDNPETLRRWLDELPWNTRMWTVGATLRAELSLFAVLPSPKRAALLDTVENVVRTHQREDGFFGTDADSWESRLSGTYKIAGFLAASDRVVPRSKEMAKTLIHHLESKEFNNTIVLYNAINLLNVLQQQGVIFSPQLRIKMARQCVMNFGRLRIEGSGFPTQRHASSPSANGRLLAANVLEANTNATGLAISARAYLIEFLTGKPSPPPHPQAANLAEALTGYAANTASPLNDNKASH